MSHLRSIVIKLTEEECNAYLAVAEQIKKSVVFRQRQAEREKFFDANPNIPADELAAAAKRAGLYKLSTVETDIARFIRTHREKSIVNPL